MVIVGGPAVIQRSRLREASPHGCHGGIDILPEMGKERT